MILEHRLVLQNHVVVVVVDQYLLVQYLLTQCLLYRPLLHRRMIQPWLIQSWAIHLWRRGFWGRKRRWGLGIFRERGGISILRVAVLSSGFGPRRTRGSCEGQIQLGRLETA
jgi:hypothetical protein